MNFRAMVLLAPLVLFACGQGPDASSPSAAPDTGATAEAPAGGPATGPGGHFEVTGAVQLAFDDLYWTITEYTPPTGQVRDGFTLVLYDRAGGMATNRVTFGGIPWDVAVNEPITLGGDLADGKVTLAFVENGMSREAADWRAVSGTLTLNEYGETIAGEFEGELTARNAEGTIAVQGRFANLPMIQPRDS